MKANKKDIERACQMVYEHFTGKCWHIIGLLLCIECNKTVWDGIKKNPPLATSLDAWAEHIWPVMPNDYDFQEIYFSSLCDQRGHVFPYYEDGTNSIDEFGMMLLSCKPLHHLEAALRAANLYDEWKKGCE
jgi:hypothetical protein